MQIVIRGSPIITEPIHPSIADRATLVRSHIEQVAKYGSGVTTLRIRVAQSAEFAWLPGQYVNLFANDGRFSSFSSAGPRLIDGCIELHVRRVPSSVCSDLAMRKFKCGDDVA
jgi:NAD(P)H-flavin reductase